MFIPLLLINFIVAFLICMAAVTIFKAPVNKVLQGRFAEDVSTVWVKYITFATYIIGISIGTRIWDMEKYLGGRELNYDRMALEIYKTVIATLQINAVMFFLFLTAVWIASIVKKK